MNDDNGKKEDGEKEEDGKKREIVLNLFPITFSFSKEKIFPVLRTRERGKKKQEGDKERRGVRKERALKHNVLVTYECSFTTWILSATLSSPLSLFHFYPFFSLFFFSLFLFLDGEKIWEKEWKDEKEEEENKKMGNRIMEETKKIRIQLQDEEKEDRMEERETRRGRIERIREKEGKKMMEKRMEMIL